MSSSQSQLTSGAKGRLEGITLQAWLEVRSGAPRVGGGRNELGSSYFRVTFELLSSYFRATFSK